jgi:methionyl-tRNA formyltransferase
VESCHVETEKLKNWPPTAVELRKICNEVAGKLLLRTLPLWVEGKIKAKNQEHDKATYSRKITTEDRKIDLTADDYKNFLKIQAFSAWGTYFFAEKKGEKIRVIIKSAEFKEGKLVLLKVIPEGKKEMSFEDFARGL